ncbi:MAG: PQQ-binding-like beta-propeller repeat protein [Alkalispirochaetaceae bacterium]
MSRVLRGSLVLSVLLMLAACGGEPSGEEGGETPAAEEVEEPQGPEERISPVSPGRSGVYGPLEVDAPAAAFGVVRGTAGGVIDTVVRTGNGRVILTEGGELSVYEGGEFRWGRSGALLPPVVDGELLFGGGGEEVTGFDLASGEVLWSRSLGLPVRDLQLLDSRVVALAGNEMVWLSVEGGRIEERRKLLGRGIELLSAGEALFALTTEGIEAVDQSRQPLWSEELPDGRRMTLGGEPQLIVLEAGSALIAVDPATGVMVWQRQMEPLPVYRPVPAGDSVFIAYASGRLDQVALESGALRSSRGVASSIHARPAVWNARLWVPTDPGVLELHRLSGGRLGRVELGTKETLSLYAAGEGLGVIDRYGGFAELSGEGRELVVRLDEPEGEELSLPELRPGEGPLLLSLTSQPRELKLPELEEGIYLFSLPLQNRSEAVIDVRDADGTFLGSNLDKTELAEELRIRLEGGQRYTVDVRPVREAQIGEIVALTLRSGRP